MSDTPALPPLLSSAPRILPPGDPGFRPPILAYRRYAEAVAAAGGGTPVRIAIERESGLRSCFTTPILPPGPATTPATLRLVERIVKFLLWSRGGWRILLQAPPEIGLPIREAYAHGGARGFDAALMARVYGFDFAVEIVDEATCPESSENALALGGHWDGCRLGFDLGASDFKLAAVRDGETVFTAEIPWQPQTQSDPAYHYDHLREGLRAAAAHLPRVDAIGGSAAGIYIDNQVRSASLFRGVPPDIFERTVKSMFLRMRREWGVPLEVVNDGEVTALAARLSLGQPSVLGLAMGSSQAAGFIDAAGTLPGWLDELAFAPVDMRPDAPADEWSGDRGVGANYYSQQATARLAPALGIAFPAGMGLPERLAGLQDLMARGDERAAGVFETIGVYLGYTLPWYELFYDYRHVLVLGRVLTGRGGDILVRKASHVLAEEFPETARRVTIHVLDDKSRRVGQAVAAASLPVLKKAGAAAATSDGARARLLPDAP